MREACLASKQLHADLEQFSLFSESEMLNLVESCELNNALARATAMDALVRLRFDYLFDRVTNKKIDREQALQFIDKLISSLLAPDFSGDTARLPASGSEQFDVEFEKIKNIQISRRESMATLVEGIRSGNAGTILRAGSLWKAADRIADLELRAKTLGPKESY